MPKNDDAGNAIGGEGSAISLPPFLRELLDHKQLILNPSSGDLREMGKFTELPNIAGLPAYPINRPAPRDLARQFETLDWDNPPARGDAFAIAPEPELPAGVQKPLARTLSQHGCIVIDGTMRPYSRKSESYLETDAITIRVIVPMPWAPLAVAAQRLLHPAQPAAGPADYTLLIYGEPVRKRSGEVVEEMLIGHWPGAAPGCGLVIGSDDPRIPILLLHDAVRTLWAARGVEADWGFARGVLPADQLVCERHWLYEMGIIVLGIAPDAQGDFTDLPESGVVILNQ